MPLPTSRRTAAHQIMVSSRCCTGNSGRRTQDSGRTWRKSPCCGARRLPWGCANAWGWLYTGLRQAYTKFRSDPCQPLRNWLRDYCGAHAIPVGARESTVDSRHASSCPPWKTSVPAIWFGSRTWNSGDRTPIAGRAGFSSRHQPRQATRSTHPADVGEPRVHIFPVCAQKIPVEFGKAPVWLGAHMIYQYVMCFRL